MLKQEKNESVVNAISELISEIIGTMYQLESQVWIEEPHDLCKQFIESGEDVYISAALKIYTGMFDKVAEQMMVEYKNDLLKVFEVTLVNENLNVAFLALKACCKIVFALERKDSQYFVP